MTRNDGNRSAPPVFSRKNGSRNLPRSNGAGAKVENRGETSAMERVCITSPKQVFCVKFMKILWKPGKINKTHWKKFIKISEKIQKKVKNAKIMGFGRKNRWKNQKKWNERKVSLKNLKIFKLHIHLAEQSRGVLKISIKFEKKNQKNRKLTQNSVMNFFAGTNCRNSNVLEVLLVEQKESVHIDLKIEFFEN